MSPKIAANNDEPLLGDIGSYEDPETLRVAQARAFIESVLARPEYNGVAYKLAQEWEINSAHFTQLRRYSKLSPTLDDYLVENGHLPKRLPIDPRPRVWMRTDDVSLAVEQLARHYSMEEIAQGLAQNLELNQSLHFSVSTLVDDDSQIAK